MKLWRSDIIFSTNILKEIEKNLHFFKVHRERVDLCYWFWGFCKITATGHCSCRELTVLFSGRSGVLVLLSPCKESPLTATRSSSIVYNVSIMRYSHRMASKDWDHIPWIWKININIYVFYILVYIKNRVNLKPWMKIIDWPTFDKLLVELFYYYP